MIVIGAVVVLFIYRQVIVIFGRRGAEGTPVIRTYSELRTDSGEEVTVELREKLALT